MWWWSYRCTGKPLIFVFFVVLGVHLLATRVRADVVVTDDNVVFGKVLSITTESAVVANGCNKKLTESIGASRIRTVIFDSGCNAHNYTVPAVATSPCSAEEITAYRVNFKDDVTPVYANKLLFKADDPIHILLAGGEGSLHGPLDQVTSITYGRFCPLLFNRINAIQLPRGYCFEPPRLAVNWSPDPVYNNGIFTKGFSFYLEQVGPGNSQLTAEDIRLAFGTAVTLWASPLLAKKDSLDPQLRDFVDKSVARSKNIVMFVPPQVVNVSCPANASMIVKLYTARGDEFSSDSYVAKAQVRGRTILLNGVDYQFLSKLGMKEVAEQNRINLIAVFAHELGHAFGLTHSNAGPSIMSDRKPTLVPTDSDIQRFIAILRQSIIGARPGFFNPIECAGLRLKKH
jgi:Matrixin